MIRFLKKLYTQWYISSIVAAISFFLVAGSLLAILAWRMSSSEESLGGLVEIETSLLLSFLISSFLAFTLADDKKIVSLLLSWLLIAVTMAVLLFLAPML